MLSEKQKSILESCEYVSKDDFLDTFWDSALIGYAERGGPGKFVLPVYGYQAMKAVLNNKNYTPRQTYSILYKTLSQPILGRRPLLLKKYNSKTLWDRIKVENYPRWEYLDKAILGLGSANFGMQGICYNKQKCIDILQSISSSSSDNNWRNFLDMSYKLDNTIISISLGEKSPWFITYIK